MELKLQFPSSGNMVTDNLVVSDCQGPPPGQAGHASQAGYAARQAGETSHADRASQAGQMGQAGQASQAGQAGQGRAASACPSLFGKVKAHRLGSADYDLHREET